MSNSQEFFLKTINHVSGSFVSMIAAIGQKLGFFDDLYQNGPANLQDFSRRNNVNERYAQEWLTALSSVGYLRLDEKTNQYYIPEDHKDVLANKEHSFYLAPLFSMISSFYKVFDKVENSFHEGGGVSISSYDITLWTEWEKLFHVKMQNNLVENWLPNSENVQKMLKEGALVADLGCGSGHSMIKLANSFPKSRFIGYDIIELNIELANKMVKKDKLENIVSFKQLDIETDEIPQKFDIILLFDVLHDLKQPLQMLRKIRDALNPSGILLLLEIDIDNAAKGPFAGMLYGFSLFYCLTTSLARNGVGMGTMNLSVDKLNSLCKESGFDEVKVIPISHPYNVIYEVR